MPKSGFFKYTATYITMRSKGVARQETFVRSYA